MSPTTTPAEDMTKISYVGGPRHGRFTSRQSPTQPWPPRKVDCQSEIAPGSKLGFYVLRGTELHWRDYHPTVYKS